MPATVHTSFIQKTTIDQENNVTNCWKRFNRYSQTWVTPKGQKHIINKALRGKFDDTYQNLHITETHRKTVKD
ncbi:hypothetical protein EFP31_06170 [Lactobacillus johnsonii]|nr:hypothetical protein [Lactobacillus johnsonii]